MVCIKKCCAAYSSLIFSHASLSSLLHVYLPLLRSSLPLPLPLLPFVPLLFAGLPSDVTYFLSCGADKVLLKPLDLNKFGLAMREAIDEMN